MRDVSVSVDFKQATLPGEKRATLVCEPQLIEKDETKKRANDEFDTIFTAMRQVVSVENNGE